MLNNIEKDDNDSLLKEFTKVYNKYNKKYKGYQLESQIKNSLYRKGYNIDDINRVIEENI